ncbi:MAG: hypothetical protein Q8L87_15480 [Anaerolineales bacterium]|nr:hypothetical protein [Anaerolineales bacterium]
MKPIHALVWIAFVAALAACQTADTTAPSTGELTTQVAATIYAEQTSAVPPTPTLNAIYQAATAGALTASAPRTPTSTPAFDTYEINVPAEACWMDTEVTVLTGQTITIYASGIGNTYGGNEGSNADPDGQKYICGAIECPVQGVGYGALVGRLEDLKPFFVGTYFQFTATKDGSLHFTINDWECQDNSGSFDLKIVVD